MPANPLHFLAVLPLHLKSPDKFDALSLLVSSTFVDLEMVVMVLLGKPMTHGIMHSYIMIFTFYPLILSITIYTLFKKTNKKMKKIYEYFKFNQESIDLTFKQIYVNCLVGGVSHLFLDMWTHEYSMYLFYPITTVNPFWLGQASILVTSITIIASIYSVLLWWRNGLNTKIN
ncbi:DUF4184 family protein [Candidatus Bathyarchaeota archaeon]|nr:DUF4184 family protein [Candidatus Bathyarchaeota archaeon]